MLYSQKLGAKPGDFACLVDTVGEILGEAFPEILKDPETVKEVINAKGFSNLNNLLVRFFMLVKLERHKNTTT